MSFSARLVCTEAAEERFTRRYRVLLEATGSGAGLDAAPILVHDLSTEGFLIESDAPLSNGDQVTIDLPTAGSVEAEIVWSSGRFFGGRFAARLSPGAVRAAAQESPVVWPDFPGTPQPDATHRTQAGQSLIDAQRPSDRGDRGFAARMRVIAGVAALFWTAAAGMIWAFVEASRP